MDKKNAVLLPGSACVHMFLCGLAPAAPDCAGKIRTINAESPGFFPLGLRRCDQQNNTFCAIPPPMTPIFTATGCSSGSQNLPSKRCRRQGCSTAVARDFGVSTPSIESARG